ncbi:hypothetical protein M0802_016158 [Mischocyttarus mexicanus]|nr:hypothetical protein M0802_016158 [Mischocyttarus mexicanus]
MHSYFACLSLLSRHISALEPLASHARVHEQVERLLDLPAMKTRTSHGLPWIVNIVESSLSAIEALGCSVEHWSPIVLQRASSALDARTREDWEHHLGTSTEVHPYQRLLSLISAAARPMEHIERLKTHKEQQTSPQPAKPQTSHRQAATSQTSQGQSLPFIQDLSNNCCYCRRQHYLAFCLQFASLSRKDRVEVVMEARLCFNCLGRHNVRQCRSKRSQRHLR